MREVLQKVLEAEAEAGRLVAAATSEAAAIVAGARVRSQQHVDRAGEASRAEAAQQIDAAIRRGAEEQRERLAQAARDIEAEIKLDDKTRSAVVDDTLRCVCPETG